VSIASRCGIDTCPLQWTLDTNPSMPVINDIHTNY
jgi:hypothetical protein